MGPQKFHNSQLCITIQLHDLSIQQQQQILFSLLSYVIQINVNINTFHFMSYSLLGDNHGKICIWDTR